jgi:long-chain acyl-CoA synthetase
VKKAMKGVSSRIDIHVFDSLRTKPSPETSGNLITEDVKKTAFIIYTSGTTGSPKGVMLSFENLYANIDSVVNVGIYTEENTVMVLLPIHHILPLLGSVIAPLSVNATIAMTPSMMTDDILKTLADNRVAIIIGVPRFYEVIRKGIMDKINASAVTRILFRTARAINSMSFSRKLFNKVHQRFGGNVKYMVSGGAALDLEIGRDFRTLGFDILEGYGMTEAAPMITFPRPGNVRLGTTGQALTGTEIKIVKGEICARGRNIMQGYYNRPEETAAVLKGGWLHTGDLGELDGKGFLSITGRKKDIIVLPNGKNINPAEIEEKIMASSQLIQEAEVYLKDRKLQMLLRFGRSDLTGNAESEQRLAYELVSQYNRSVSPYKKIMRSEERRVGKEC